MKLYDYGFECIFTNGKWFKIGFQFMDEENMTTIKGGEFNRVVDVYIIVFRFSIYWNE